MQSSPRRSYQPELAEKRSKKVSKAVMNGVRLNLTVISFDDEHSSMLKEIKFVSWHHNMNTHTNKYLLT